jgi:endonuclease VIII-like 1
MPELPEIFKMALLVRELHRRGERFLEVSCPSELWTKDPLPPAEAPIWPAKPWQISALSRGKELLLIIRSVAAAGAGDPEKIALAASSSSSSSATAGPPRKRKGRTPSTASPGLSSPPVLYVRLNMGMSGILLWQDKDTQRDLQHVHLQFTSPAGVLQFVDPRRFGRITWNPPTPWSPDRSPDPVLEYDQFVEYLGEQLPRLRQSSRTVVDVLSDQRFFNGIGNYLRAEILHRLGVGPLVPIHQAVAACEPVAKAGAPVEVFTRQNRLFLACQAVPLEVLALPKDLASHVLSREDDSTQYIGGDAFAAWLQVYGRTSEASQLRVGGQTVWYQGNPKRLPPPDRILEIIFDPALTTSDLLVAARQSLSSAFALNPPSLPTTTTTTTATTSTPSKRERPDASPPAATATATHRRSERIKRQRK